MNASGRKIRIRIITDVGPWLDGRPLAEGAIVELSPEDARPFIEKRFAVEVGNG